VVREIHQFFGNMDSAGPLDPLDPNIPSRQSNCKFQAAQKPLPPPPPPFDRTASEAPVSSAATTTSEAPSHVTRPSSSGGATFQRPRKRVIWRNKACFVALPIDSEFGKKTTRESYLGCEDVTRRLQDWESKGYDTTGFLLAPSSPDPLSHSSEGQSREVHPNPEDEIQERMGRNYRVNIPDRQEWEEYVNHLKEEKLRALGVSFGDEDPPKKSPAPSLMSRQASSQSSAMLTSPALAPQSVPGMPFSPGFHSASNQAAQLSKPSVSSVSHFPRYSVATPFGEKPFSPTNQFPRPGQSPVHGAFLPQQYMGSQPGSRIASPNVDGRTSSSLGMLPPAPPPAQNGIGQVSSHGPAELLNQMRRQQALLQAQQLHQHQQYQQHQQMLQSHSRISTESNPDHNLRPLPLASSSHPEMASPIPRGHRQNPSETLQKDVDEAETHPKAATTQVDRQQGPMVDEKDLSKDGAANLKQAKKDVFLNGKTDGSDLETSPSLSSTPDLFNDRQSLPQREHSSTVSASKLNVNAPEFKYEPEKSTDPGVFAFMGDQQHSDPKERASTSQARSIKEAPPQAMKFNVEAPEFTPGAIVRKSTIPSEPFSFSASLPTFRPDAPAFKPRDLQAAPTSDISDKENSVEAVKKIFGEINFSEATKSAKKSKAIPIIEPEKDSGKLEKNGLESDGQEDESGRITQADGRQKRMRRGLEDGDQVPLFASPNQTPWMNHGDNDRAAYFSRTPSPRSEKADASTLEAATDLLEEIIDDLSATEASDLMREDESVSEEEKSFEPHAFHDIDDAVNFNAARPPVSQREQASHHNDLTPGDVAKATIDFLGKSPQFKADIDQALDYRTSGSRSTPLEHLGLGDRIDRVDHAPQDIMDGVRYVEPSYNELDAIMKHLNEDSDYGVERRPSPFKRRGQSMSPVRSSAPEHHHTSRSPVRDSTRELYETSRTPQLLPPANLRSDAPSPSPNRLRGLTQCLPQTDSESANTSAIETIEQISREIANNPLNSPSWPINTPIPVHHLNSPGSTPPSDWNDAISSLDEDKFRSRTGFFDTRVNELVGSVVQQRLGPLEQALSGIQQSLAAISSRSASRRPRSSGTVEVVNSDADDEDTEELSQTRLKSPLRDRKYEQLKSTINDITAAQRNFASATQLAEVMEAVKDLKTSMLQVPPMHTDGMDIKTVVEEAVGKQMRGRSAPVTSSSVAAVAEKSQLQIAGLESMLKVAENRADDELKARRSNEDALADNQRLLRSALQEAAEQRESAEATERTLGEYSEERQEMLQRTAMLERSEGHSQKTISDLSNKSAALEDTLGEYRLSSDQWRTEIDDARHENKDLRRNINSLRAEIEENTESRHTLRNKFDVLQEDMTQASQVTVADQLRWQGKEQEHNARLEMLHARLEAEARTRERLELEIERLEEKEKEAMQTRLGVEQAQNANAKLQDLVTGLRFESHGHHNSAARFERELKDVRESSTMEIERIRKTMEADVENARNQANILGADREVMIAKLQRQMDVVTADANNARARHELMLEEAAKSRNAALQEIADKREAALQEQNRLHERTLSALKAQHERALNNAREDRGRSETYFGNRLNLADEKLGHYQDRIAHLEEKLEIAKSAAHAAVQAVQNKKPALSPVSSITTRSNPRASEVPEKVSPQALRESILVLQEQLQERESRIEQLESELSAVDTAAPGKVKDAEVEITWLRELLGVRIDDLEDIIAILSRPAYDREAVKDAAIRLKANLQMEQQEKERALAGGPNFPSLASMSNLAASPKALPLAAAAAWGNWRKGREGFGSLSAVANGSVQQTPSKSSPQSFFAGLMTPPSTSMRTTPPITSSSRPLSSSSKRAVRSPTTPRQSLSGRHDMRLQQDPVTPPLMRKASYDLDASENVSGFGDEGIEGSRMASEDEEPFGPRLGGIVGTM